MSKLKVLFINSEWNGVAYWRMWEPARFLNKRDDIEVTYWLSEAEMKKPAEEWERLAKSHDVIVCGRTSDPESLATILVVRELSQKPIIMEMDDNWWDVDPNSPAYDYWTPGKQAYTVAGKQCELTDFFQFSTVQLKRQMCHVFNKWEQSFIAKNLIDFDLWKPKKHRRKTLRIGWAGSATHYTDFKIILPALVKIMEKHKNVELHIRGLKADFFVQEKDEITFDDLRKRNAFRVKSPLPLDRVKYYDGCNFNDWPKAVADMELDICLVPLVQSKFNEAKSNCRYLEFSALGIPGVYSDLAPYSQTIKHGVDGFVPMRNNIDKWVEYLSALIDDETLRKNIGDAARQKVWEQYSFQNKVYEWAENYHRVAAHMKTTSFRSYYGDFIIEAENG